MDKIPEKIDSKFRYVLLAAQRAEQMMRGAAPRIEVDENQAKPTRIAMKEITQDRVEWDYGAEEPEAEEPIEEEELTDEEPEV